MKKIVFERLMTEDKLTDNEEHAIIGGDDPNGVECLPGSPERWVC